jgi:translation initiation factor 1
MAKDWKERLGVVYSTNPDFGYEKDKEEEQTTVDSKKQTLRVHFEKKHRNGKSVTLVNGFIGPDADLQSLARLLKTQCGTGGSAKEGEILIQGEKVEKVKEILKKEGYKVK